MTINTKQLDDGTEVPDRVYYYLLAWNDSNKEHMQSLYNKARLGSLTTKEFWEFWEWATNSDTPVEFR